MSERTKDFLERLAFTVAFVAVGLAIPYLTGINEAWAVPIVAGLQIVKNLLAQQVGDPNTSGFTDTPFPPSEPIVDDADVESVEDVQGVPDDFEGELS